MLRLPHPNPSPEGEGLKSRKLVASTSPARTGLLAAAALLATTTPLHAQTIAFTNGTVAIGDGSQPIERGTVVIKDGRVVAAGKDVAVPAGARVIDASGKWIAAGIVAGMTQLGIAEGYGIETTNDASAAKSPFSAAIDIVPAINPATPAIANDRAGGVTRAIVAPSVANSIFAGQGAVIDLAADSDAVTRPRAFQFVELGEAGRDSGGGSRASAHLLFRSALIEAQDYARAPAAYGQNGQMLTRADAAALVPVVTGRMLLLVHAERASDIRQTLALRKEFPNLKLVLVGATEGWMVAPEIAAAGVPVIASALADLPAAFETLAATESNVGRLTRAGIVTGISLIDLGPPPIQRNLTQYAGNLVALTRVPGSSGLDWGAAFASITSKPAAAIGMDAEIGSLRPGRRADVVLWDGDPLEFSSEPEAVFIDGIQQPMDNRQTKLRKRYATPVEGDLPKAYER